MKAGGQRCFDGGEIGKPTKRVGGGHGRGKGENGRWGHIISTGSRSLVTTAPAQGLHAGCCVATRA
jgi:hypothetical protein